MLCRSRKCARLLSLFSIATLFLTSKFVTVMGESIAGAQQTAKKTKTDVALIQPELKDEKPLPDGALFRVGRGHVGQIAALGLVDNAKTLLTSAKDDTLGLWDLKTGKTSGRIVAPHS